jgi:cysteine desulfurase
MRRIYLDHTATTSLDPRVYEAMQPFFRETFGPASSIHWYGQQAEASLEHARENLARAIEAECEKRPRTEDIWLLSKASQTML